VSPRGLALVGVFLLGSVMLSSSAGARVNGRTHPSLRYCDSHGRPRGCIRVPSGARRPSRAVNEQGGPALTPREVVNGGGLGGGPAEGRATAVAWARTQLGSAIWAFRCERFVEEAFGTRYQFASAALAAKHLPLHLGPITTAPAGTLVYFGGDRFNKSFGHVGLSLGRGAMISALDTVQITNVARSPYWSNLYRGWTEAPSMWPGRLPPPPAVTGPLVSSTVQITAPAFASMLSGTVQLEASAQNVGGVEFEAYYATDPTDSRSVGWHVLGDAVQSEGSWALAWNTLAVPDQGNPLLGTVNLAAIALDVSGRTTGTRDYRRVSVNNSGALTTGGGTTSGGGTGSPPGGPPPQTFSETTGGVTHTWSNYTNAGGTEGPSIPAFTTVQIACKVTGFRVADGDTWWYRVASDPWSGTYYGSADAFYNNGQTSGSLKGTPFYDPSVPGC